MTYQEFLLLPAKCHKSQGGNCKESTNNTILRFCVFFSGGRRIPFSGGQLPHNIQTRRCVPYFFKSLILLLSYERFKNIRL